MMGWIVAGVLLLVVIGLLAYAANFFWKLFTRG